MRIFILLLATIFISLQVIADGVDSVIKKFNDDTESIAAFGCHGASENDYAMFQGKLDKYDVEFPNAEIYERARCGDGKMILENTLRPGSYVFLKKFVIGVYKRYGKDEVKKIINLPESIWGYTLLEEAIALNGCQESLSAGNRSDMIDYLKKVGGTMRPGFIENNCKTD